MNFCLDCDRPLEDNDGELCHICADRRESMREEEFRRLEEEGVDFGGAMVEGFREMFQSWTR